jgi:hypothetical protein
MCVIGKRIEKKVSQLVPRQMFIHWDPACKDKAGWVNTTGLNVGA